METTWRAARVLLLLLLILPLAACEIVGGIFKAGVWVGVILVAVVVIGILWFVAKARG